MWKSDEEGSQQIEWLFNALERPLRRPFSPALGSSEEALGRRENRRLKKRSFKNKVVSWIKRLYLHKNMRFHDNCPEK